MVDSSLSSVSTTFIGNSVCILSTFPFKMSESRRRGVERCPFLSSGVEPTGRSNRDKLVLGSSSFTCHRSSQYIHRIHKFSDRMNVMCYGNMTSL